MALAERELKAYNPLLGPFEDLYNENIGLIKRISQDYYRKVHHLNALEFDDVKQIATLAFLESYHRYTKVTDNVSFKKHATITMHQKIKRYLDYKVQIIHIPTLKRIDGYHINVVSFDEPINGTEDLTFEDFICVEPDDETYPAVMEFVNGLKPTWRTYTLMRMDFKTLEEIGEKFGISREAVRQSLKRVGDNYLHWKKTGTYKKTGRQVYGK